MGFIDIHSFIKTLNFGLEKLAVITFWVWLAMIVIKYIRKSASKEDVGKSVYIGLVVCLEAIALVFVIYFPLPHLIVSLSNHKLELATVRWAILYLVAVSWSYFVSYKKSGRRGITSVLIVLTILLFGWLYDRWLGIVFMSLPILVMYWYIISKVAQVILPASKPEDKAEAWRKTRAFLAYIFGIQHPIWMAKEKTGREFEKQLDGNSGTEIGKPGIIWTWSHQVAGIAKGVIFSRADGPGPIFTEQHESPFALVDLRMQSRVSVVNTVTKDGIKIPTVVFTAFALDKRNSSTTKPRRHRAGNAENFNIDHMDGSFVYSSGRVSTALSMTGVNNPRLGETPKKPELFWDEWVVRQIEHVTRLVVAERSLDELWRPQHDDLGASALSEIASRLQELLTPQLGEVGINLITARIVNYQLPKDDPIVKRNIESWSSYWKQKITEANADIETIRREEHEKARAYSKSILLSAIAESITKARHIHEDLPRHVIAQYYVQALEEYFKGPSLNTSESKERLAIIKGILANNQKEGTE